MKTVFVVDDEKDIRDSLEGIFTDEGYRVSTAESAEEAVEKLAESSPDVILLDIWMPGKDGIELLKEIKVEYKDIPVIMISGHATIDTAVKTTKLGAYDFIEKPISLESVVLTVSHALEERRLVAENTVLRDSVQREYNIIGETDIMKSLKEDIGVVAPSQSWVLITGDNGTGKEFVARNIHMRSSRSERAFVEVNCAAIPEDLIESELFGHEKGAFTGALARKKGKFDIADKGTIFLDEIGDMSLKTQAKILRLLQEQSFERVGGTELIKVDVRVVAATNKDLLTEIKAGSFREDLYYRLNVIPFYVPPLRERRDDIHFFVEHYLGEFARRSVNKAPEMSKAALKLLTKYDWPGNVRELKNLIERLVIMTTGVEIGTGDIPAYIRKSDPSARGRRDYDAMSLKEARGAFEKEFILSKLEEFGGNIAKTAESIGVERSNLYRKIKDYGITT